MNNENAVSIQVGPDAELKKTVRKKTEIDRRDNG